MSQLEHWAAVVDKVTAVEEFISWLWTEKKIELDWSRAVPGTSLDQKKLIYEFFEVDAKKLDDERRALLDANRKQFEKSRG